MSASPPARSSIEIRRAREDDLDAIMAMVDDFARDHPSAQHPRRRERVRAAYFTGEPVARVFVAERRGEVVGMAQWIRAFDMFWNMPGGRAEWLYVRPDARGQGIAPALIAALCDDVRRGGGEYLCGGYDERLAPLYEQVTIGWPARECYLSEECFQVMADLAGQPPRAVVRGLPTPDLNRVPARPR
ncbi:MAG TPA: GNAT family N-acetyltransferase [Kofleriaceae bacterium]|nr:GNAT family N-acetyltransferase [Kofleriaceae bacterium]